MPNYDLFSPLLLITTFEEMTIKHLMYMQKVPFLYTQKGPVYRNLPWKILDVEQSVATISDQREYIVLSSLSSTTFVVGVGCEE